MPRHLTPLPNSLPILIQHKRNWYKQNREPSQQAISPTHPQFRIQRMRKKWTRRPERAPNQIIAGVHARHIFRVCIAEICQDAHEEQKGANAEERGPDDGHDPVDIWTCRPTEPEEADGDEEGANESGDKAFFRANLASLRVEFWLHVFVDIPEKWGDRDQRAKEDAKESEARFSGGEVVGALKDYGEGFKPKIK